MQNKLASSVRQKRECKVLSLEFETRQSFFPLFKQFTSENPIFSQTPTWAPNLTTFAIELSLWLVGMFHFCKPTPFDNQTLKGFIILKYKFLL